MATNDFWPSDTDTRMYIETEFSTTLQDILERSQQKWPGIEMAEIEMSAEHIHTKCIGYDLYEPADYTNFLKIQPSSSYLERVTKPA